MVNKEAITSKKWIDRYRRREKQVLSQRTVFTRNLILEKHGLY